MLGIGIDITSSRPRFQQIADQLQSRIREGTLPSGYQLPPTRALAGEIGTHRNTVVRAYEELAKRGLVESTVGRGTFVRADTQVDGASAPAGDAMDSPHRAPLPWDSLLSRIGSAEAFSRADRLSQQVVPDDVVHLTRMQPSDDLLPAAELRRCINHVLRTNGAAALGYAHKGLPRLRELIARDLAHVGVPAAPEDIVITTGSQQALDMISRVLVDPGDRIVVEAETYSGAITLFTASGARLVSAPADAEGPDVPALDRMARGAKALYLMPNCRNPTGHCIGTARRQALVDWSHDAGVPLIEDDYGVDLELDAVPAPPALRALDRDVLYVSTFSKRLIPALRVGFVVAPPDIRRPLIALKRTMDLGTSALLQHALAEFLDRGYLRTHLARTLPIYRKRRDALVAALRKYLPADIHFEPRARGVVLWLELPPRLRAEAVFAEALRNGVVVSPASLHTVSGHEQSGLRLTFCAEPEARLVEGARRLGKAIADLERQGTSSTNNPVITGI